MNHSNTKDADPENAKPPSNENALDDPPEQATIIDEVRNDLTRRMVETAERFDSFFDDERYVEEENATTLRLQFDTFFQEYESVDLKVRARLDLKVPALEDNLEKKFKLIISGDPDDSVEPDDFGADEPGAFASDIDRGDDDRGNFTVSGQYFLLDTIKRNASARAGLKFRSLKPVAFGEIRYKGQNISDIATTRFTPRARWWTDRGWDLKADFDIEAPVVENLFFRTTLGGSWQQDKDGFFYDLSYRVFQMLDKRRALEYEWRNNFQTEPVHRLTRVTWRVNYREQIWRKWLFYEIAPEIAFREFEDGRDYRFVPGIQFRLEVRFEREDRERKKKKNK